MGLEGDFYHSLNFLTSFEFYIYFLKSISKSVLRGLMTYESLKDSFKALKFSIFSSLVNGIMFYELCKYLYHFSSQTLLQTRPSPGVRGGQAREDQSSM